MSQRDIDLARRLLALHINDLPPGVAIDFALRIHMVDMEQRDDPKNGAPRPKSTPAKTRPRSKRRPAR